MSALAFFFFWLLYYCIKGIYIRENFVKTFFPILTLIFWVLTFHFAGNFSANWEIILKAYLIISLCDYIIMMTSDKSILIDFLFSYIYVQAESVTIRYQFIRLPLIILVNIASLIIKRELVGNFEKIEISVKSNDNTNINISI